MKRAARERVQVLARQQVARRRRQVVQVGLLRLLLLLLLWRRRSAAAGDRRQCGGGCCRGRLLLALTGGVLLLRNRHIDLGRQRVGQVLLVLLLLGGRGKSGSIESRRERAQVAASACCGLLASRKRQPARHVGEQEYYVQ